MECGVPRTRCNERRTPKKNNSNNQTNMNTQLKQVLSKSLVLATVDPRHNPVYVQGFGIEIVHPGFKRFFPGLPNQKKRVSATLPWHFDQETTQTNLLQARPRERVNQLPLPRVLLRLPCPVLSDHL